MYSTIGISVLCLVASSVACVACVKPVTPEFDADSYYSSIEGKSGKDLKGGLNAVIKGHIRYPYSCLWYLLKETDEDPLNVNNVIGFYTRRSIPKSHQDKGGHDMNAWNREHIWPKSHGFPKKRQYAYTDAHHIRAADKSVNTDRNDNDFSFGGILDDECTECREGAHTWEVPNIVKGDVARMVFYMVVRYEGNDDSHTPDLELVNRKTMPGENFLGKLCDLLHWHQQDPVSNEERRRNDVVYRWQGNRNPFIDNPKWVNSIFGDGCLTPSGLVSD